MHTQITSPTIAKNRRRIPWLRVGGIVLLLLLLAIAAFVGWAAFPQSPMPEAIAALKSDDGVTVNQQKWIEFIPTEQPPTTGFIFYPGGRVDARAYAPAMRKLAEAGFYAVIVPMPLNLAFFAPNRADEVRAAHPEIQKWAIGGHSLGGVMAASYVFNHPDAINGLALWASYPQASTSLATLAQLSVTSIYGSQDGLVAPTVIHESSQFLPKQTNFVVIEGGNHGQFGWYGTQSGDNPATINHQEQMDQVVAATLPLLQNIQSSLR